jgi:hypothetical protein
VRQNCVQDVLPTQTCAIDSIAGGRAHSKPEIWNTAQAASKPVVSPKLRLSQTFVHDNPFSSEQMPNLRLSKTASMLF